MKKIISICMALILVLTMAACGTKTVKLEGVSEANDILTTVWNSYEESEKFFVLGGDAANMVTDAPGTYSLEDKEALAVQLVCTEKAAQMIDGAASLFHAMNTNVFTAAAFHMAPGANQDEFIAEMQQALKANQWMCGAPEKYLIAAAGGEYTVVAFGTADNIDVFQAKLLTAYPVVEISVQEAF